MPIGPDKWGVHGWKFIHHIALGYPNNPSENEKNNYKSFFILLGNVLPCNICSEHYYENLLRHPLTDDVFSSKINLINWTIDMHNEVNKKNGKKIYKYDEALELIRNNYNIYESYENISSNNLLSNNLSSKIQSSESKNNKIYILLFIILLVFIFFVMKKKKLI